MDDIFYRSKKQAREIRILFWKIKKSKTYRFLNAYARTVDICSLVKLFSPKNIKFGAPVRNKDEKLYVGNSLLFTGLACAVLCFGNLFIQGSCLNILNGSI